MSVESVITENLDIWTSAIKTKSASGRGSSNKLELYGIKKLRELILELAVRGKLVPQDLNDEPASKLLEKISIERAELVKTKAIKKQKQLPEVNEDELSFSIPSNWSWTRLGNITEIGPRNDIDDEQKVAFIPMPLISTSYDGKHGQETRIWSEVKKGYTHFADGDIAIAKITPCFENSKAAYFSNLQGGVGCGTTELHVARPIPDTLDPLFILLYLKAPMFLELGKTKMTGSAGQKRVPKDFFAGNPLPFPPLNEQKRIVAKVNELMKLCDQLESKTESSIEAHKTLVETLLATLTNAKDAEELNENWQRISEHFDTLFTTEDSIDQLKQTILQLAVMGKLVKQDPNDEPASALLERIAQEKEQLIKDKKIKKQKALAPLEDVAKPYDLPSDWSWCRLEDVVDIQSGITKGRKLAGRELITIPYLSVANVQRSYLELENVKEVDIPIDEQDKYEVKKGDLLITEGGDWDKVGRTAIWNNEMPYVGHQNHVFKARRFLSSQNVVWLEKYLNSTVARDYFAGSSKQTTNLASINKTQLRGCLIAIPPTAEQERIVNRIESMFTLCDQLRLKVINAQLTQLSIADSISSSLVN
ncbi:restriction endonuclease EcoAI subunit S [Pseudoalteromonas lipolytica SCSIO 04301]|uniref:restriction endonuclease subunit S n=1 Tax=Pseudoalteromonas lipolytica TaxID=570156 RepID=UPI0004525124|nr:restriction endonuclease subunit S [Pseudoalteromonas lipolytica]EWH05412.1 restriction endonuclease EcoAI subunit S [Pseudoalteromonas lipolytica SCSIO 04301]